MKTIRLLLLLCLCAVEALAQNFNFSNTTPAPPAGGTNVLWQKDSSSTVNVSAYIATDVFAKLGAANTFGAFQNSFAASTWLWPACVAGVSSATNQSCLDAGTGPHVWNPFTSADVLIGSGSGHVYWNPSVCVVQASAPVLGGSLSPATPPVATLTTAGDDTHPQTCGASYSFTNRGTAQWMEWHKNLEVANPTGNLVVNFYTDAATSGNVIWNGVLACGAASGTNHPVYGTAQPLGTVVPGAINTIYSATLSNLNITCAAGSTVWLRLYLDSSTTSTGNILISDVQWTEQ